MDNAGRYLSSAKIARTNIDMPDQPDTILLMTAIRVIFDGKAFVPQQPVSLPSQSEALVLVDQTDPSAQTDLDTAVRAYYQSANVEDAEDAAWANATAPRSASAWDQD